METFTEPKELVENPHYQEQRQKSLAGLTDVMIDVPIIKIITDFNNMGQWNNLTVTNCVIRNIYWRALFVAGNHSTSGHVVRDNTVENVRGGTESAAIMLAGSTGEIVNNTVADASIGVAFWPGTTGSVAGGRADSHGVLRHVDSACNFPSRHPLNLSMHDDILTRADLILCLDVRGWERPATKLGSARETITLRPWLVSLISLIKKVSR